MKGKILYIGLLSVLTTLSACDDFLQKDPPSSPSESIFWQKEADFEYGLNSCYSVAYEWPGVFSQAMPSYDNLTDNALCQYDEDTYGQTKSMMMGDLYPTTGGFVSRNFSLAYKAISRCNLFLTKLSEYQGNDISEENRKYMEAQGKALRAYYYHWLYLCYKEVPLFTDFLSLENQYQPKATRKEIYDQIIKDFSEAIANFDDRTYMEAPGRITKSACLAFMAKVTMFNGFSDENGIPCGIANPELMKKIVEYCEQIKGYSLDDDLRMAFVESKQMDSKEMIFSVRYASPDICNNLNEVYCCWSSLMVQRNLVDVFECTDGLPWGESPLTVPVDEDLINSRTADHNLIVAEREKLFENRDKRLCNSITVASVYRFPERPNYPNNAVIYNNEPSLTGFGPIRFIQPFEEGVNPGNMQVGPDINLMRYAHVLLMLAEAENELNGPTQKAYNAINQVRVRAGQPELPKDLTKEQFRDRVRKEWRYETPFEGWRYFQLKQWNELKSVPSVVAKEPFYTVAAIYEDRFMFWPLPQTEIDKANGVLVQDPAYK